MSKANKVNVRGLQEIVDDKYRYKMPAVNLVKQKNKSVITNLADVAKALDRDPQMLVEYYKNKLSIPVKLDKDLVDVKNSTLVEIQGATHEFIEYFVICPTCRIPETELSVKKSCLYAKCKACSHNGEVKQVNKVVGKVSDAIVKLLSK